MTFIFMRCNEGYEKNIRQYTKKDGISAFILYGLFISNYVILALLCLSINGIKGNMVIGSIFNIGIGIITMLFIKFNKQHLSSIGLIGGQWKKSCIIGIILASILFFNNCGFHLLHGAHLIERNDIIIHIFYYLTVSFCEEMVFRGYIGTRIYGFIKRKWIAIIVVGLLFMLMHFPYRMIASGMSLKELTVDNMFWLVDLFVTHIVLTIVYMKTNSLYGAIFPHWMADLAYSMIQW